MKNTILKTITATMTILAILCLCCLDTPGTNIFYTGALVGLAWDLLFILANRDRLEV